MINPTVNDIGRKVLYMYPVLRGYGPAEEGVITSFNTTCVFVRYGNDLHSKATLREDLEFLVKARDGIGEG